MQQIEKDVEDNHAKTKDNGRKDCVCFLPKPRQIPANDLSFAVIIRAAITLCYVHVAILSKATYKRVADEKQ